MHTAEATSTFDTSKSIRVSIESGGQKKTALLTFGDDAFWFERNRKTPTTRRNLGRNKSITDPAAIENVDLELFNKIRVDHDGDEFDAFEASAAISKLERNEVTNIARSGEGYDISMTALGCELTHVLKVPTQKDVIEFGRHSVRVIDARKTQDIRIYLEPAVELYDRLKVRTVGYTGGIPVIHKAAVVSELISDLQSRDDSESVSFI